MAFIMAVLPGISIDAMDKMDIPELMRWQDKAARIQEAKAGKGPR